MKTTRFLTVFLTIFLPFYLMAQDKKTIPSKINEATVFFSGAELLHTTTSTLLVSGENEIYIEGLSNDVDLNSLKVKAPNGVVVSAYEYSIDYLSTSSRSTPLIKSLQDSIKICENKLNKISIDVKVNKSSLELLQTGITKNVSGSEKGLGIDEMMKTMEYYRTKTTEMEIAQTALEKEKKDLTEILGRLNKQLNLEMNKGHRTSGILKLNLSASRTMNVAFIITYFTSKASWTPYYDINVTSTDAPIKIIQKAKVKQTTGLDWNKVKLTLSTGIPSNGKVAPLFNTWFLEQLKYATVSPKSPPMMAQNSYSYDETIEIEGALENKVPGTVVRGMSSIKSSAQPIFIIDGKQMSQEEMSSLDPNMIKGIEVLKDASATAIYGSKASDEVVLITLKDSMDDYITESDNALNQVFNIELPYTIPDNGKEQNIDLQSKEASAEYKYYCAPKLDTETYLLAEISNWEKFGLITGKANITYDGTYIGETLIDASSTHEKLTLTLGTDKRVSVKREKMKDFSSTKFLGSDVQQVFTYRITVKNNQNKPIKMVLKDQYPLSTQKKIEVNLLKETTPWTANKEDVGVITWEEEFSAGESKVYQISYSVKYPKGMRLNL